MWYISKIHKYSWFNITIFYRWNLRMTTYDLYHFYHLIYFIQGHRNNFLAKNCNANNEYDLLCVNIVNKLISFFRHTETICEKKCLNCQLLCRHVASEKWKRVRGTSPYHHVKINVHDKIIDYLRLIGNAGILKKISLFYRS